MTLIVRGQASLRGLYVNKFNTILGNAVKEDSLLHYAQDSSFNYLALYSLPSINLSNTNTANNLASFISRARTNFGIQYVGAVTENYNNIQNKIVPYNNSRSDDNEKFNVFNVEFEFWSTSSTGPGGYYCTQYLIPNNCACDTSGGFQFFIDQMHKIDSLASQQQVLSEVYLGWFNEGQAQQISQNVDRILLHAYRTNTSTLYSYSKTRLQHLASLNASVDVAALFSSEPDFMGPWLDTHGQIEAFEKYQSDFDNDNNTWKQYINVIGDHWFNYGFMPKPPPPFSPTITTPGAFSFCAGDSITLTASPGDSYLWSNGSTTASITVQAAANYTCDVTINNVTITTPVAAVMLNSKPTVSIQEGLALQGQVPITSSCLAGSGTIANYQWRLNGSNINGGTGSNYTAVVSGNYSLKVTNSLGCQTESPALAVLVPGPTCMPSVPTGLSSSPTTEVSEHVTWSGNQSGDSIVIRYHTSNSTNYQYIGMPYTGQNSYTLSGLIPATQYSWKVKMMCGNSSGDYSNGANFTTGPMTNDIADLKDGTTGTSAISMDISPNPANAYAGIIITSPVSGQGELSILDVKGTVVHQQQATFAPGETRMEIETSALNNGLYLLKFRSDAAFQTRKLLISH